MKKRVKIEIFCAILAVVLFFSAFAALRARFPRPYLETVQASGIDNSLVYSVIKAESGFDEKTVSNAGAVGLMQLLPSTAKFICDREGIFYEEARLTEAEYNLRLGTLYLKYLFDKFSAVETALAAYNAGEGTVADWLKDANCSADGINLSRIPYPETKRYIKKIKKFLKFYEFLY